MDDTQRMTVARAYVDASNDHDIDGIAALLAPDVAYRSSGVGAHDGAAKILAMNRTFFGDYPDVHWDPVNWRHIGDGGIEFDFTITLGGQSHRGVERVFVDDTGRISRVEVER